MVDSKFPWSTMYKGFYGADTVRHFGLQYAPYDFFKYFIGVVLGLQLILVACLAVELRSYSKGSTTWLVGNKLKQFSKILCFASLVLSYPIVFGLTSFADCDYATSKLRRFSNVKCWTTEASIWSAIGISGVFVQIFTSCLGVIM